MWIQSLSPLEDTLSLTASEEVSTFEVGLLKTPLPTTVWRSTGLTPFVVGNFAASVDVDTWGPWYTNAVVGDQTRLRLANTEAALTAAPLIDVTVDVIPGSPSADYISKFRANFFYVHQRATITPTAALWFRVDFDYTGNSDGFVQVGTLPIGERLTLAQEHAYRNGFERTTDPRAGFTAQLSGGGLQLGGYTAKRNWTGTLITNKDEWLDDIQPLLDSRMNGPVTIVLEETEDARPFDSMFFGYLRGQSSGQRALQEIPVVITEP